MRRGPWRRRHTRMRPRQLLGQGFDELAAAVSRQASGKGWGAAAQMIPWEQFSRQR